MAVVEIWQTNHEKLCAARWGTLMKLIVWGGGAALSLVLTIAGWGLTKTWDGQQEQMRILRDMQTRVMAAQAQR